MGMTISGTSVLDAEVLPHQHHVDAPNPLVNNYRTSDGHIVSLAFLQSDRYWPEFCVATDKLDWLADDRFTDSAARATNAQDLIAMLDELFLERTLEEWEKVLSSQDGQWDVLLPAGRVKDDLQAQANGYVQHIAHDGEGKVSLVPAPAQFDGEVPRLDRAPAIGADTDDVLSAHGFDHDAIADLRARGIVR
jgi:crotonobetainyl-CoA:carnitine CoA-transferase CaiB-like acyl-CoA transferase